jgi:hypothetical protein
VVGLHAPIAYTPGVGPLVFAERGAGVAFVVDEERGSRVVHGAREGKRYAAVGQPALSPDGTRVAHGALVDGRWRMVVDGEEGPAYDAVKGPVFSPDGAHVAYQAMDGELWRLVVDRTASRGSRSRVLAHRFSADSTRIAYLDDADGEGKGRLVVSDLRFQKPTVVAAGVTSFALGADGSLAWIAARSGKRFVVANGREEELSGELRGPLVVGTGGASIAALVRSDDGVRLRRFFAGAGGAGPAYDDAEELVASADGRSHAFAARRGPSWFLVVDGMEGAPFDRVVTPRFRPDGKMVAYRARKDGRRFVVVADADGKTRTVHPPFAQVFPVEWAADGSTVSYGIVQGRQAMWREEAP